ncbi:DUF3987 domain-containing protein [Paracoccus sp. PAR01]|uniref:DUF3987 domain-containing protein n=1 Tax=Paracoccus sp. PAR01 TaxID=2769282 RepID=UPI001782CB7A|nr:DUF3987 domain-containing protein [Paracoccus sp. PAR01]MBD9527841.1 DUF3987 domain-containing protein [Paracoccus sp. PAR01]
MNKALHPAPVAVNFGDVPLCCGLGISDTLKDREGAVYSGVTFHEIVELAENPQEVPKESALWVIPSDYREADARAHAVQAERGKLWLLPLDLDAGNPPLDVAMKLVRTVIGEGPTLVGYSTHGSSPEVPKSRVLVPLAEPVAGASWRLTVEAYNDLLETVSSGLLIPDEKLHSTGQVMFLPNRGEHYEYRIDPAGTIVGLNLTEDHPISIRREQLRLIEDEVKLSLSKRAVARMKQASKRGAGKDVIGAYNEAHEVEDLLARFGYQRKSPTSEHWRSPHQTSGSYATRVYEGMTSQYWISQSESDRKAGVGPATKQGGACHGDAFDLFVHYEHGGDFKAAVRGYAEAIGLGPKKPPEVTEGQRREVKERMQAKKAEPDEAESRVIESGAEDRTLQQRETARLDRDDPQYAEFCRRHGFEPGEMSGGIEEAVMREAMDNEIAPPLDLWGSFEAPDLPLGLLPKVIEDFALSQGRLKGIEPGAFAMAALACCGAVLDDKIILRPKVHDAKWQESARLWVMLVGDPSARKSPVLDAATWRAEEEHDRLMGNNATNLAQWNALPKDERATTPKPPLQWLILKDATPEASQELFMNAPKGLFMVEDEMSRFFGSMNQFKGGKGADRGYWTKAYDGKKFSANRVGRGHIVVPKLSMSMLGAVQPEVIRHVAMNTEDNGLVQRMIPVVMGSSGVDQDIPSGPETEAYDNAVGGLYLLRMPPDLAFLSFDADAQAIRQELALRHHKLKALDQLSNKLAEHIGKYDGMFARLCIIWHCLEHLRVEHPMKTPLAAQVTEDTARRVGDFMARFILPQAIAFYGSTLDLGQGFEGPQAVASYILTKKLPRITLREARSNVRALKNLKTPKEAEDVMATLVQFGWLVPVDGPRRDSREWTVNPAVHELYEDRARIEAERIERAKEGMQVAFARQK